MKFIIIWSIFIIFANAKDQVVYNFSNNFKRNKLPEGFELLNENISNGPITKNRNKDNGTKRNLYSMLRNEDDSFYYKYDEFNRLKNETSIKSEYLCEIRSQLRPEVIKGYDISCPFYYTIVIDKVFYGRYKKDFIHCVDGTKSNNYKKRYTKKRIEKRKINKMLCGYEPIEKVKNSCEGKSYCTLIPNKTFYYNKCRNKLKYLHIDYHCKKSKELKKEKITIVSFYDNIESNSVQEHSVSELYQYANIHGYEFEYSKLNYMPERSVYFMKIAIIIEKLLEGLKYKKYNWIVWADSDVIILNPNIKLETFLPDEKMNNKIHLIIARDPFYNGVNSGVIFIRVHEWSLNLISRVMSYPYYNKEKILRRPEQDALSNILLEFKESEHYVIVPPEWFNTSLIKKGGFLYHIMSKRKNERFFKFLNTSKGDEEWYSRTNEDMRKEVMNYYKLRKEEQLQIGIQR